MVTEPGLWPGRLSERLYPVNTPVDQLPVDGYRPPDAEAWSPRPASVLLAISRDSSPELILTVRSGDLDHHPGQVALPGGGYSDGDQFPVGTALREAQEEVGIPVDGVRVLGLMRRFDTITGYRIVPVVGLVESAGSLSACPREVVSIFTLPLQRVLDLRSYACHEVQRAGRSHDVWSMRTERWPVWGATAAILAHLAELADSGR